MSNKDVLIFIEHILESIKDISAFILKTSKKEFSENKTFQLKQLIVDEDEIRAMLRIIGREQTRKYGS